MNVDEVILCSDDGDDDGVAHDGVSLNVVNGDEGSGVGNYDDDFKGDGF